MMNKIVVLLWFISSLNSLVTAADLDISSALDSMNVWRNSDPLRCITFGNKVNNEILISKNSDSQNQARWNYYYGSALMNISSYNQAEKYVLSASDYYESVDEIMFGNCKLNLGVIYWNLTEYDKSAEVLFEAINIYERNGDLDGVALCYNNLGNIYGDQKQLDKALDAYLKCFQIYKEMGDESSYFRPLNNIGIVFSEKGMLDSALKYYQYSLDINIKYKKSKKDFSIAYNNLGSVLVKMDSLEKAWEYQIKALDLQEEINDLRGMSYSHKLIAEVYRKRKSYNKAEEHLLIAIDLTYDANIVSERLSCFHQLYELYVSTGKYKLAFPLVDSIQKLNATIFNLKNAEIIASVQTQLDISEKEKENLALRTENQIQEERKEAFLKISIVIIISLFVLCFVIYRRFQLKKEANEVLAVKNQELDDAYHIISEKNKEVTDSIKYAKRIQSALLPLNENLESGAKEVSVVYKPRDIVSGDFYWALPTDNKVYWVVGDCTGHGVPGALMSTIGIALLHDVIVKDGLTDAGKILTELNKQLIKRLKQSDDEQSTKDGMDLGIIIKDLTRNEITFAGANFDLFVKRKNGVEVIKGDRAPIGYYYDSNQNFQPCVVPIEEGDWLVMSSDGYYDQFGGEKNKKLKKSGLKEILSNLPDTSDKEVISQSLEDSFESWKGQVEQIDDVCIMVIKV